MSRREDWPERLGEVLLAAQAREFRYGDHDCALHFGDAAAAVTGQDPFAEFRGGYETLRAGLTQIRKRWGVTSLEQLMDKHHERVAPVMAQRGDCALIDAEQPDGSRLPALAVVDGPWLVGPCGVRVPRSEALICWKVG